MGAGSYANGGMLPHMGGPTQYSQQQMMVWAMEQQALAQQQQFWHPQPGPPSPSHHPPMNGPMSGPAPMGGPPPGGAANYAHMRAPEPAPMPIAAGPGAAMM